MLPCLPGGWAHNLAMTPPPTRVKPSPSWLRADLCLPRVSSSPGFSLEPPIILVTSYSISQEFLAPMGQCLRKHFS